MTWGTISGGPINYCTWNSLYPFNYTSNYGGQYQFNVMPLGTSYQDAFAMRNLGNPWFTGASYLNSVMQMFTPNYPNMALNATAYNQGYEIGTQLGNRTLFQLAANDISSLKSQLENTIKSERLNAEQKQQLSEYKQQVEELENKLREVETLRQQGATSAQIREAINGIRAEFTELKNEVQEAANKILAEVNNNENNNDEVEENEEVANNENVEDNENTEDNVSDNKRTGRPKELGEAPKNKEIREWASKFNRAINVWYGTDDDDFEAALNEIDESNIMEYVNYYNSHYAGKGFFFDFLADAEHGQKKDFTPKLLNALETRAEALGIEDEIAEEVAVINDELNDCNISKTIISKRLESIAAKINAAENPQET